VVVAKPVVEVVAKLVVEVVTKLVVDGAVDVVDDVIDVIEDAVDNMVDAVIGVEFGELANVEAEIPTIEATNTAGADVEGIAEWDAD
jgi:hypothetical protein